MFRLRSTWFERMLGGKVDSLGVPLSMSVICFTRLERKPGNKVDSLGVPTLNIFIMFYI